MKKDFSLFVLYIFIFLGVMYFLTPISFNKQNQNMALKQDISQNDFEIQDEMTAQLISDLKDKDQTQSNQKYVNAIKYGALWFYNNQNNNFLHYEYDVSKDAYSPESQELRETASLWAISKAANFTDGKIFKNLANKGFAYFEKYFKCSSSNDFCYLNITPDNKNIGYSGFVIMSLLEMEHPKKDYYLEKFANGILYQQNADGSLNTHFYSEKSNNVDYYPGEALIALAKLYEYNSEEKYLQALKKAFVYYRKYWYENKNTPFIPWQSRAYAKLYEFSKDQEVADFVFDMNDYLIEIQAKHNPCSDFVFNQGIIIAVRMEGMNQAYKTAKLVGDEKKAQCYAQYTKDGSDYILTLQTKKADGVNKKAIGGFLQNPDGTTHRVDRNQHAIMALMEAIELEILK